MNEAWSELSLPRARLSPPGAAPVANPQQAGPPAEEPFAALAVLAAIAALQDAAAAQQDDAVAARPDAAVTAQQDSVIARQGTAPAAQQEAACAAASVNIRPQSPPRQGDGDQLGALIAAIEAAQRKGSRPLLS